MKLVFTKPHLSSKDSEFPSFFMGNALRGYLEYRNVFIGKENVDFTINFNSFHGGYDISLFEIPANGNPSRHIDEAIAALKEDGTNVKQISYTWKWIDQKQIKGKRLWIEAVSDTNSSPEGE
jgi:hypothetical protein